MSDEITQKARYDFKKQLDELQKLSGRATEMISLYVPSSKQISDVVSYLRDEYSQSSNIKSKGTRKNVMSAIDSIIARLRTYKSVPESGLVLFVGHVSTGKDQTDMVNYVLLPLEPIGTFTYRCDSSFYFEPLLDMIADKETYGLLILDRKEATIGLLRGKKIEVVYSHESQVPSKHGMGGQSAHRFERLIEIAAHDWFKRVGEKASEIFLQEKNLRGVIIGGPGPTKDYFANEHFLHYEVEKKVTPPTIDIGYTDEYGLRELVEKASDMLTDVALVHEKKLMERFLSEVVKDNGLAAYGEDEIRQHLQNGAVETLLISEDIHKSRATLTCENPNCGAQKTKTISDEDDIPACSACSSSMSITDRIDIVDDLSELAGKTSAGIEFISTEFSEGKNLHDAFGGIAAILRYRA